MKLTRELIEADLEEQFSRSSGPGGQNVNKVSTKVTLRHRPSNISVTVQEGRSQSGNRQVARVRLLEAIQTSEREAVLKARAEKEKKRRQNAPRPKGVIRRMVDNKKKRSVVKQGRGRPRSDD